MSTQEYYTIKEVAEILKLSEKTIRRRIKNNEIEAELMNSPYGKQYFIPKNQIDKAIEIVDVITMKKQHSVEDLSLIISNYINSRDSDIVQVIEQFKNDIRQEVRKEFEEREESIIKQIKTENQRLIDYIESQNKKSFWSRFFK